MCPLENLEEFLESINVPLPKEEFLKRERPIRVTLFLAKNYGFNMDFIEPGLNIIDIRHECPAGEIDLLGLDNESSLVTIEIKPGIANHSTVGQIQAYLEAMQEKYPRKKVRGIVIAPKTNVGYSYSLKASKLKNAIKFISLLKFDEEIYNIYIEIATKRDNYQFYINQALERKKRIETLEDLESVIERIVD